MATFGLTASEIEQNFGTYDLDDLGSQISRWIGYAVASLDARLQSLGTSADVVEALASGTLYDLSRGYCESWVSARVARSISLQDPDLAKAHEQTATSLLARLVATYESIAPGYDVSTGRSTPRFRTGRRRRGRGLGEI